MGINGLVDKTEEAGNQGDVEEAQGILKLSDQLKEEREELKNTIGAARGTTTAEGQFGPPKAMEVCETCGAFLIVGDAQQRIDDHLMGKLHVGYARMRATVEQIQEVRRKVREQRELEKDKEIEERRKRREENNEASGVEVKQEGDGDNRVSRDRDSRDRRHRSRSRDRRRSRSR